jgi:DNA-binding transcriptional MerR regulator
MSGEPILPKAFYSIGEVSDLAGVKPHVLRYWEAQIPVLRPRKNRGGKRVYRPDDVALVLQVRHLLYEEKLTLDGVKQRLVDGDVMEMSESLSQSMVSSEILRGLREDLEGLRVLLDPDRPWQAKPRAESENASFETAEESPIQSAQDPFPQLQLEMDADTEWGGGR